MKLSKSRKIQTLIRIFLEKFGITGEIPNFMKKYEIPKGYLVNINKIGSIKFDEGIHIEEIDCFNKHF